MNKNLIYLNIFELTKIYNCVFCHIMLIPMVLRMSVTLQ